MCMRSKGQGWTLRWQVRFKGKVWRSELSLASLGFCEPIKRGSVEALCVVDALEMATALTATWGKDREGRGQQMSCHLYDC